MGLDGGRLVSASARRRPLSLFPARLLFLRGWDEVGGRRQGGVGGESCSVEVQRAYGLRRELPFQIGGQRGRKRVFKSHALLTELCNLRAEVLHVRRRAHALVGCLGGARSLEQRCLRLTLRLLFGQQLLDAREHVLVLSRTRARERTQRQVCAQGGHVAGVCAGRASGGRVVGVCRACVGRVSGVWRTLRYRVVDYRVNALVRSRGEPLFDGALPDPPALTKRLRLRLAVRVHLLRSRSQLGTLLCQPCLERCHVRLTARIKCLLRLEQHLKFSGLVLRPKLGLAHLARRRIRLHQLHSRRGEQLVLEAQRILAMGHEVVGLCDLMRE